MIKQEKRYCLNLIYFTPLKRGNYEIIDEIIPVYGIEVKINVPETITDVYSGVSGEKYDFAYNGSTLEFTVPVLKLHESIVLEFCKNG